MRLRKRKYETALHINKDVTEAESAGGNSGTQGTQGTCELGLTPPHRALREWLGGEAKGPARVAGENGATSQGVEGMGPRRGGASRPGVEAKGPQGTSLAFCPPHWDSE